MIIRSAFHISYSIFKHWITRILAKQETKFRNTRNNAIRYLVTAKVNSMEYTKSKIVEINKKYLTLFKIASWSYLRNSKIVKWANVKLIFKIFMLTNFVPFFVLFSFRILSFPLNKTVINVLDAEHSDTII